VRPAGPPRSTCISLVNSGIKDENADPLRGKIFDSVTPSDHGLETFPVFEFHMIGSKPNPHDGPRKSLVC
jgi:hypothetical protein